MALVNKNLNPAKSRYPKWIVAFLMTGITFIRFKKHEAEQGFCFSPKELLRSCRFVFIPSCDHASSLIMTKLSKNSDSFFLDDRFSRQHDPAD